MPCRYALPVFLAFSNPHEISPYFAVLCIAANVIGALDVCLSICSGIQYMAVPLLSFLHVLTGTNFAGTALNSGSDWYKAGAKAAGGGLVTTGPYSWSLRPNFLGDWLRLGSTCWWHALLLPWHTASAKPSLPDLISAVGNVMSPCQQRSVETVMCPMAGT
jgi:steroid 5-alpha reductase family enzyme